MRLSTHIRVGAVVLVLALAASGCGSSSKKSSTSTSPSGNKPAVTFGTKNFPEQFLLGQLYAQALRAKGFKVELKSDVGATEIIYRALTLGTLDAYPEYTGVLRSVIGGDDKRSSSKLAAYNEARQVAAREGISMLEPTPFEDRDDLAVRPQFASRYHLRTIADLAHVPRTVRVAGPPEFRTRVQGFLGLMTEYGLTNIRFKPLQIGSQYQALDSGSIDVADVFTTDGQLQGGSYVLLKDPKRLFGYQNVAPLVRQKVLDTEGPLFGQTMNAVSAKLTTSAMRRMNAAVALRRESPAVVADSFLRANGLK